MKKQLIINIIACILALLTYFGFQIYKKIEAKKVFAEQVKRLPKSTNFQWIGKQAPNNDAKTIILFFNPDCDHCQYEAKAILEHNITVLSKIYLNISFKRIGKFLDIAPEQAESIIAEMVAEKRIKARLDHLS